MRRIALFLACLILPAAAAGDELSVCSSSVILSHDDLRRT